MEKMKNTLSIYLTLFFTIVSFKVVFCEISVSLCPPFKPALVPYPGDCTKFIKCSYGQSTIFSCKIGTIFSPKLNRCISSEIMNHCQDITNGSQSIQVFCPRYSNDRFPHPFNCKKFVACNYGMTYITDCALGTVYNPLTTDCDWPRNVPGCSKNFGNGINLRNDVAFFSENLRNGRLDFRFRNLIDDDKKHQKVIKSKHEYNANRTHQGNGLGHQVNKHQDAIQSKNNIKDKHPYNQSKNSSEDLSQNKYGKQNESSTNKSISKYQLQSTSSNHYSPKKLDHDQTKKQLNHSTQNENNDRNRKSNQTTNEIGNSPPTQASSYTQTTVLYDQQKSRAGFQTQPKYTNQNRQLNIQNNSSINIRSRYNLTKNQSSTPARTRHDKHNQQSKQESHIDSHLHSTSMRNNIETTTIPNKQLENQSTSFNQIKHSRQEQSTSSSVNDYTQTTVPHGQLNNEKHVSKEKIQSNSLNVSNWIDITSHVPLIQGINHVGTKTPDQLVHRETSTTETEHYYQNHLPGRQNSIMNHSLSTLGELYVQRTAFPDRLSNLTQTEHSNQNQLYGKQTEVTSIMPLIHTDGNIQATISYNLTENPIGSFTEKKNIDQDDLTSYKINGIDSFMEISEGDYTQMPVSYDRQIRQNNDVTQNKYVNESQPSSDKIDLMNLELSPSRFDLVIAKFPEDHTDNQGSSGVQVRNGVKHRSTDQSNVTTHVPAAVTNNYDQTTIHHDHEDQVNLRARTDNKSQHFSTSYTSNVTTHAPSTTKKNHYQTTTHRDQTDNRMTSRAPIENENQSFSSGYHTDATTHIPLTTTKKYYHTTTYHDQFGNQVNSRTQIKNDDRRRSSSYRNDLTTHVPATVTESYHQMTHQIPMRNANQNGSFNYQSDVTTNIPTTMTKNYDQTTIYHDFLANEVNTRAQFDNEDSRRSSSHYSNITTYLPSNIKENHYQTTTHHDRLNNQFYSRAPMENEKQSSLTTYQSDVASRVPSIMTEDHYQTTRYHNQPHNQVKVDSRMRNEDQNSSLNHQSVTTSAPVTLTDNLYQTTIYNVQSENKVSSGIQIANEEQSISSSYQGDVTTHIPSTIIDHYQTTVHLNQPDNQLKIRDQIENEERRFPSSYQNDLTTHIPSNATEKYYQTTMHHDQPENLFNFRDQIENDDRHSSSYQIEITSHIPSTITENYHQTIINHDQLESHLNSRAQIANEEQSLSSGYQDDVTTHVPSTITENHYQTTVYHDQFENKESLINQSRFDHYNQSLKNSTPLNVHIFSNGSVNHLKNLSNNLRGHIRVPNDTNSVDQHLSVVHSTYSSSYSPLNRSDYYSYESALNNQSKDQSTSVHTTGYDNLSKCSHTEQNIIINIDLLDNSVEKIFSCKDNNNITSISEKSDNDTRTEHQDINTEGSLSRGYNATNTNDKIVSVSTTIKTFESNDLNKVDTHSEDAIQPTNIENEGDHKKHQPSSIINELYNKYHRVNKSNEKVNDPLFYSPIIFDVQIIDSSNNRSTKSLESMNETLSNNTVVKNSSPADFYYYYNTEDHVNSTGKIDEDYFRTPNHTKNFIINGNSRNIEYQTFEELNQKSSSIRKVFGETTDNTSISTLFITPFKSMNEKQHGVIDQLSGQTFRLRSGSGAHYGYVEIEGIGLVGLCDNSWNLKKASKVCKKLGYKRGAEISWKSQTNDNKFSLSLLESNIICQDNTAKFQPCTFAKNAGCSIERDTIGVKCLVDSSAYCKPNEVPFNQNCYHLVNSSLDLNHEDAIHYCSSMSSSLLYITAQDENDFISEWLTQKHPQVESVMTAGIGFPTLGNTIWVWQDSSKSLFNFTKWWPGWKNEKKLSPSIKSKVSCIVMKNKFPCYNQPNSSCETDGYFFWDVEDCAMSMKGSYYICKRPYNNTIY